jgi:hypothetical protein
MAFLSTFTDILKASELTRDEIQFDVFVRSFSYTMLGYKLSREQLDHDDLCSTSFQTSIDSLCRFNRNELIRGRTSLGTILEQHELGTVYPSLRHRRPVESRVFFSGGFITSEYSSNINTIQIELPWQIRTGTNRYHHATNYARAIVEYMQVHNLLKSLTKTSSFV